MTAERPPGSMFASPVSAGQEMNGGRPRVPVLGGGFGGIGAAQKLGKSDDDVVVVDKHDYHTFQPLLYQLATGLLEQPAVGLEEPSSKGQS
jgi:hypothetical protein